MQLFWYIFHQHLVFFIQDSIDEALKELIFSLRGSKLKSSGILNVSRFPVTQNEERDNKVKICTCESCDCCTERILVTHFVEYAAERNDIKRPSSDDQVDDDDRMGGTESMNSDVSFKWFTLNEMEEMIQRFGTNKTGVSLHGPEPILYAKLASEDVLNITLNDSICDFNQNLTVNSLIMANHNKNLSETDEFESSEFSELRLNVLGQNGKKYHNDIILLVKEHQSKVNAKVPKLVQEKLFSTVDFDADEMLFLRQQFYGKSFPSCFISLDSFCGSFCETLLGESDTLRQEDYFR